MLEAKVLKIVFLSQSSHVLTIGKHPLSRKKNILEKTVGF